MALIFNNNLLNQLFGKKFNSISIIPIDVTLNEVHRRSNSLTRRAVEGGATITDNVIILPDTVTMNCIIKDTLLGDSWEEKLDKIDQIRRAREPFDIVTSLGAYDSMFFDGSIVINRDVTTNTVLAFSATFSKVFIIETLSEAVPKESIKSGHEKTVAPSEGLGKKQLLDQSEARIQSGLFILRGLTEGVQVF